MPVNPLQLVCVRVHVCVCVCVCERTHERVLAGLLEMRALQKQKGDKYMGVTCRTGAQYSIKLSCFISTTAVQATT